MGLCLRVISSLSAAAAAAAKALYSSWSSSNPFVRDRDLCLRLYLLPILILIHVLIYDFKLMHFYYLTGNKFIEKSRYVANVRIKLLCELLWPFQSFSGL